MSTIIPNARGNGTCFDKILVETRHDGPEYSDSFNDFVSKQKLQQALKYWSNFSLVLFGKGRQNREQL